MNAKYIRTPAGMFVFPASITHFDFAMAVRDVIATRDIISAGFVGLDRDLGPCCYGRSVSLDRDSKPEDSDTLMKMIEGDR